MDNIAIELDKPAIEVMKHNLVGILEGAIRNSNA